MDSFNRFYLWGLDMKYRMSLYTVAAVFFKAVANALSGIYTVDSLILLEMLLVSLVFASLETLLFPTGKDWGADRQKLALLWSGLANLFYIGAALLLGWFRGVPLWGGALLVLLLELGIAAMWYALYLSARRDTENLNRRLRSFQRSNGSPQKD